MQVSFAQFLEGGMEFILFMMIFSPRSATDEEWPSIVSPIAAVFRCSLSPTLRSLDAAGPAVEDLAIQVQGSAMLLLDRILQVLQGMDPS